jgi:hypothetical protein
MKAHQVVSASERVRARKELLAVVTAVAAALVPKCPLCVAAALSALGVGAAVAHGVAPLLRPVAMALAVGLALASGWRAFVATSPCSRRSAPRSTAFPCPHTKAPRKPLW